MRSELESNKWRLLFLVFIVAYAFLLLFNLGYMSVQWDEMPHLYGARLLLNGQTQNYLTAYGYYPPLYDIMTTGIFSVFGAGAIAGRLISVIFSVLAIWVVFEFANRAYGPKIALLSSILLGTMPGFFWFSRIAMLETMLIFFFTLSLFFFLSWVQTHSNKMILFAGLTLGIGFLAKYQIAVAAIIILLSLIVFYRTKVRQHLTKFLVIALIAALIALPWIALVYQVNGTTKFGEIVYVMNEGAQKRLEYSSRFPMPIFYLIELTWPYNDVHPISLPIFILGLLGLGFMAYRRNKEDKLLLTWFIVIYVFFTLISNKQWRYVDPLFPALAMSAAIFIAFLYGRIRVWNPKPSLKANRYRKFLAPLFIVIIISTIFYSSYEAYSMTARDQIRLPIQETANYLSSHLGQNESAVIVCSFNMLDQDMFLFYMPANTSKDVIWQYPELPVDAFKAYFNINEFVSLCEQRNVKYIVMYDYGAYSPFYNTTLTYSDVAQMIADSHRFGDPVDQPFFGEMPHRLFLVRFLNQTT
jgi:4-amino-4-deoxy-L-arabinose transferase-like glycosyltransferase